jgi:dGTPase
LSKALIDLLVIDAIESSRLRLQSAHITGLEQVYQTPQPLIVLSAPVETALLQLEKFLMERMYMHPTLRQTAQKVRSWLEKLYSHLCRCPQEMPRYYQQLIAEQGTPRTVCDYVSGMTDRYCIKLAEAIA